MSSDYSNLKIELMKDGENNSTWGDVTNVNLGTAIEEAITGSADVTFSSADVTLSLTNTNASQQARNLRLNLTGAATAGFNLIVPSIEKVYIINNATTGTITVKNATGTGIAVPSGKTAWVYNTGVNVVDVANYLTSLTLGSALPITSGGTGGTTQATARAALAAAASGANSDITSLTGLTTPISIAQGGTGQTTATAARNALGAGTVTSVSGTGTVNGLTLSGTVTSTGSLTLGGSLSAINLTSQVTGILPLASGGTGTSAANAAAALAALGGMSGTFNGTPSSGYATFLLGGTTFKLLWQDVSFTTPSTTITYSSGVGFTSWSRAWINGLDGTNGRPVYISSTTTTTATLTGGFSGSGSGTLFAIGV